MALLLHVSPFVAVYPTHILVDRAHRLKSADIHHFDRLFSMELMFTSSIPFRNILQ